MAARMQIPRTRHMPRLRHRRGAATSRINRLVAGVVRHPLLGFLGAVTLALVFASVKDMIAGPRSE